MRFAALALLATGASALSFSKEEYESGAIHMSIMDSKHDQASWDRQRESGEMDASQYPALDVDVVKCVDGLAVVEAGNPNQTFKCNNMDLYDFKAHTDLGSFLGEGSGSWGWVGPDGREFGIIGQADGAAFVEITPAGKLVYLGRLPQSSVPIIWREIRVYRSYVIIGSEAVGHGIQIFDLNRLYTMDPANPSNFSTTGDITGFFNNSAYLPVGRAHNVHVSDRDYILAMGAQPRNTTCRAGLVYIDMTDPTRPNATGCASADGYTHDVECLVYRGPDTRYVGKDICYASNEDTLTIWDATNKSGFNASTIISRTPYFGARYTHQSTVIDRDWQDFLFIDDELDESNRVGPAADQFPVTYIMDISNLEAPKNTGIYKSKAFSIDHNQYVWNGLDYQSNYGAGLRVLDVSSVRADPTGAGIEEVAFFDIYPEDDALPNGGVIDFVGTWSHYANFPSGNILINTIERGAFVVKMSQFPAQGYGKYTKKIRAA
ncbi:hypothetical protein CAC42_7064 [Sphaceloma murrayae]|uniref:Uncharacterized protein n=1 Tax=Sphaceloma murrayae TaxID=2082308 RepID=A0A2K1QQR9_9PEZI|nr:hypothetical protein CAC42_7064 [Sphaceloma murrayae]